MDRGYSAPDDASQGTIYFHPRADNQRAQADFMFSTIIPEVLRRTPDLPMGEIAILYTAANVGNSSDAPVDTSSSSSTSSGSSPARRRDSIV